MSEHSENARRSFGRHTTAARQVEADQMKAPAKIDLTDPNGANSELKKKARQSTTDRGFGRYLPEEPGGAS